MATPILGYTDKNKKLLLSNVNEPTATPLPAGRVPMLGGGGTPQSRYAEQQAQLGSRSQYDQEVADATASRQRQQQILSAPQIGGMSDDMQQRINAAIESSLKAGDQDMRLGSNAINAKYANQRLGDLLNATNANAGLMQRGVESGLDMQKFNTGQANDVLMSREKMGFDKQSQENQFSQQQKLQEQSFGQQEKLQEAQLGNAQSIAEMKAKNYLTPYEATAQREKAKNDALIEQEKKKFGSTMEMLNPASDFGKNIELLIAKSTGSGLGSQIDEIYRSVGATTKGAKAIAELTPFQNQLIMMMPRGPGAQSDRDVEIARGMAGAIADPTKTVEERQAAYKGLKDYYGQLALKYGYIPDNPQQGQQQQGQYVAPDVQQQGQQKMPAGFEGFTPEEYDLFMQQNGG